MKQTRKEKLNIKKNYNRIECLKFDFMKKEFRVIVDKNRNGELLIQIVLFVCHWGIAYFDLKLQKF